MKILLAFLLGTFAALAAEPPLERIIPSHVSLSAASGGARATTQDKFKTDYGSSDLHTERNRSVSALVRNFGTAREAVELSVIWVGKKVGSNDRVILKTDERMFTLEKGQSENFKATAAMSRVAT